MKSGEAEEVKSFVSIPRLRSASRNRSGNLKIFDDLSMHSQYSMLCDKESWRIVKLNDFFITNSNLSNGREESKLSVKNLHFSEVILDPEVIAKFQTGQKRDQSLR